MIHCRQEGILIAWTACWNWLRFLADLTCLWTFEHGNLVIWFKLFTIWGGQCQNFLLRSRYITMKSSFSPVVSYLGHQNEDIWTFDRMFNRAYHCETCSEVVYETAKLWRIMIVQVQNMWFFKACHPVLCDPFDALRNKGFEIFCNCSGIWRRHICPLTTKRKSYTYF